MPIQNHEVQTEDTNRVLKNGDGVYCIEGAYVFYDSWLRMVIDCFKSGMTKEEIREGLDIENDGNLYFTEFEL